MNLLFKFSRELRKTIPNTCYIAGKISGLDYEVVKRKFNSAELRVISAGYSPVSPIEVSPYSILKTWNDYMRDCIKALYRCEYAYFMSNWKDSKGARIERVICRVLFIKIVEL